MHELLTNDEDVINPDKLEDQFFDINRIPGNGFLVFPLSMSRLFSGQDPKSLYDFLCFFEKKLEEMTVDIVFIYTNGLYFNNSSNSLILRKKTNAQMLTHKLELSKLIKTGKKFSPKSIHFIPWDYLILQAENYLGLHSVISKLVESDPFFKTLINLETKIGLEDILGNQSFIIEETIVTYLIRNKLVNLPNTLSDTNGWRLIIYPGRCLIPDVYLYQTNLLPQKKANQSDGWFAHLAAAAMYNMKRKILVDYNKIKVGSLEKPDDIILSKVELINTLRFPPELRGGLYGDI